MAGLSYLQEGGQPDQQTGVSNTAVQVKPSAGRGRIQFPTVSGTIPAGASTLEAMEEMYQEMMARQTGMRGFLEAAKDAQAWWTPGGSQRAQALEGRTQARERQAAELFNMRSQIAQYKSALEARKAFDERRKRDGTAPGGAGAGGAPGQGAVGSMFGMPPEMVRALSAPNLSEADYNKLYAEYAKKQAEIWAGPEMDKPTGKKYVVWNDERNDWVLTEPTVRDIRMNPGKYYNLDGTPAVPTAPAPAQQAMPIPEPADAAPATALAEPAPIAPPPATTPAAAAAPVNYTFDELTPEQIQTMGGMGDEMGLINDVMSRPDAPELFNQLPLDKRRGVFNALQPEPTQVVSAPAPTTDVSAPSVGAMTPPVQVAQAPVAARPPKPTAAEMERQARITEELQKQIASGTGTNIVARESTLTSQGQKADINIKQYDMLIDLLKETPNAVGIAQTPGVSSSVIALTKDGGVTLPIVGTLRAPELEEAVARKTLKPKELENRNKIGTLAQRSALEYRKEVYDKTGQVSDSETKIAELANGLSTSSPFRSNLLFAVLHKERQQLNKDRYEGWLRFQAENPGKNFGDYEKTDFYRKTSIENMDKRLRATFPDIKALKAPGERKPLSAFGRKPTQ